MTENELRINGKSFDETISLLEEFMESDDVHGELFTVLRSARDFMENLNEEIQQYKAIGTIEEFKTLKEKENEDFNMLLKAVKESYPMSKGAYMEPDVFMGDVMRKFVKYKEQS